MRKSAFGEMATKQNVEYETLLSCTSELTSEISADPLSVSEKLVAKGLIPPSLHSSAQLQAKGKELKASELVQQVTNKVKIFPSKFGVFTSILGEFLWLKDVLELINERYQQLNLNSDSQRSPQESLSSTRTGNDINGRGNQAYSFLESKATKLKAVLNIFKEKAEINPAVKIVINEEIEEFITTCLKTGCAPDDVRGILANIYHTDFLINNETLKWAMERVDSIAVQSIAKSNGDCPDQPSTKEDKKLFCDDVIYHATLCSHAASTCDENNFKKFFNEDHQHHHNLDEASLSITRKREEVDRYLIARKGKIYFIAFKSESLLSDWQEKFTSFAKGIQLQTDRIPLRFLIQQLHDGFQIILTGFSYGGLLALSVTASLWQQPNLLSSDLLQRNVCCIAFGLPLLNLPHIQETIDESPEFASTIHSFYVKNDIFPQLNVFFDPVCESILNDLGDFNADIDPKLIFQGLTTSRIINNLSALQKVHQDTVAKNPLCAAKSLLQAKLPHLLASGLIQKQSQPYNTYLIDSESGLTLHPLTKEEAMVELKNLTQPLIDAMDDRLFQRHSMSNYSCKICKILKFECEITAESLADLEVAKPSIESVSFHRHGKEIAVTIKGKDLWFCYQVKVGKHTEKINAQNVSKQSIQFNYDPELNRKISSDSAEINVSMWTHFYEQTRKKVKTDHKVYEFTFRQEQLAKLNPSELIETACMSALLEQHPHSQRKEVKYFSKRFETLRKFLEQAVTVVPVESILFAIAHANDADISRQCCTHLMKSSFLLPPSLLTSDGYLAAIGAIANDRFEEKFHYMKNDTRNKIEIEETVGERELRKQFKKYKKREKLNPMEQKVNRKVFSKRLIKDYYNRTVPIFDKRKLQQFFFQYGIEPGEYSDLLVFLAQSYHNVFSDRVSTSALDVISSVNLSSVYMIQSESDAAMCLKPSLNILVEGRKKLSWLSKQTLQGSMPKASSDSPIRLSQLYNSKMLQIVNDFRSKEVRVSCLLLAAFMEEQVKVPLMKTSFDTAKALNVALSAAAVGVWAIFSLALGDLQAVLDSIPSRSLLVEVTDYIKGVFKNDEKIADPNYAGKLQFMVQGMKETVSCNSHYVSYSLERQLIELCKKLNIDESTPLDTLVGDWDRIFKDDILSMVMLTHRSLIARWLKWALMVHHLREELARYTAVGVVGLVNSGKSLLVSTLFDIDVPVGTTAMKRTTVPFLYNLDGMIDGLDVIDFPGVDDRDETIPDLAELLLSIAQVVIFVVDYRKAHTESSKKWLEMLEDKAIPVLVCLTYADKLYAEYMGKDGSHPDPRDISREITKETEMIIEQLGQVPSHKVQFFSFSQDRDSVLNNPEGREKLQKAGIGTPQDVGDWLAGIFESQLDQDELAKKIQTFVHRN